MKPTTKTMQKVNDVYIHLNNNFSNRLFKYNEIERFLTDKDIHAMTFYYFVYAGVVSKVNKGTFKLNDSFYKTKPNIIYTRATHHLYILRKNRLQKSSNSKIKIKENFTKIINKSIGGITEDFAIKFLKDLGYKIMKPIQQFEEI